MPTLNLNPMVRGLLLLSATMALAIAVYLFWVSALTSGKPLGCGDASGCADVLGSRWSVWLGIPVSLPAALTYATLIGLLWVQPKASQGRQPLLGLLMATIGWVLLLVAVWFVGVQLFVLNAICPWCMAEHAFGAMIGATLVGSICFNSDPWRSADGERQSNEKKQSPVSRLATSLGLALVLVGQLIGIQSISEHKGPAAEQLPKDQSAQSSGVGDQRKVLLFDGKMEVSPAERPLLGIPDSKHLIVLMMDYCCPHCRATHQHVLEARKKFGDQFSVILCPVPLNTDCNPHWKETEPRFAESCQLARLAIAVWKIDPQKFSELDQWLFESQKPRAYTDALSHARTLVDPKRLEETLQSPEWINGMLKQNADFYVICKAARLPVVLGPGLTQIVGRPENQQEFDGILQRDLELKPAMDQPIGD